MNETASGSTKQEAAAAEKNASSEITCPYPTRLVSDLSFRH